MRTTLKLWLWCFTIWLSMSAAHSQEGPARNVLITLDDRVVREFDQPTWLDTETFDTVPDRILQFYLAPTHHYIFYVTVQGLLRRNTDSSARTLIAADIDEPLQVIVDETNQTLLWLTESALFTCDFDGDNFAELFTNPNVTRVKYVAGVGFYYARGDELFLRDMSDLSLESLVFTFDRTVGNFDINANRDTVYYTLTSGGDLFRAPLAGGTIERLTTTAPVRTFRLGDNDNLIYFYANQGLWTLPESGGDLTQVHLLNPNPSWVAFDFDQNMQWFLLDDRLIYRVPFNLGTNNGSRQWIMGVHYDSRRTAFYNERIVTYDLERLGWWISDFPSLDFQPFAGAANFPSDDAQLRFIPGRDDFYWFDETQILNFDSNGILLTTLPVSSATRLIDVVVDAGAQKLFILRESSGDTELLETDLSGGNEVLLHTHDSIINQWWPDPVANRHYLHNANHIEAYDGDFNPVTSWSPGAGALYYDQPGGRFFRLEAEDPVVCTRNNLLWTMTPRDTHLDQLRQGVLRDGPFVDGHWDSATQTLVGFDQPGYAFDRFTLQHPTLSPAVDMPETIVNLSIDNDNGRAFWMDPAMDGIMMGDWPPSDNPPQRVISGLFSAGRVKYVPGNQKLYYHDAWNQELREANADGSESRALVTLGDFDNPTDFSVDPVGGYFFYVYRGGLDRIALSDLTRTTLIRSVGNAREPSMKRASVAFNPHDGRLYLGYIPSLLSPNGNIYDLASLAIDGTDIQAILTGDHVYGAIEVDPYQNRVYFVHTVDYCPYRSSYLRYGTQIYALEPGAAGPELLFDFPEPDLFSSLTVWRRPLTALLVRLACWGETTGTTPSILDLIACLNGSCTGNTCAEKRDW